MPTIAVTIVDQTVAVTQVGEIGPTGATGPTGTVSAAGDGTAGAPGIAFASDTNTGLFRPGTDILAASTGGTERARIDASGNFLVGSTSATTARFLSSGGGVVFNTAGGAGTSIGRHFNVGMVTSPTDWRPYSGNTTSAIQVENSATEGFILVATESAAVPRTQLITTGGFQLNVGATIGGAGTNAIQVLSSGNVGIGTSSPVTKLTNNATKTTSTVSDSGLNWNLNEAGTYAAGIKNASGTGKGLHIETGGGHALIVENGNVGIGTTSPDALLHLTKSSAPVFRLENGDNATQSVIEFRSGASLEASIGHQANSGTLTISCGRSAGWGGEISFVVDTVAAMEINSSRHVTPGADNTQNFGSGSLRWATIFAGTGTINTSDERYKVLREGGDLSDAEHRAWSAVRAIVYRDKDSFERKGDAARLHIGYSWQSIQAAFEAEGLDPARYGLWCEDALEAPVEKTRTATRPVDGQTETVPVLDEDGQPVFEQVQETEQVEQPFEEVRMIDGAPVLVKGVRTVAQPVFDSVQIRDEDGELIFDTPQPIEDPETGELVEGDPVPRMAPVPRMITRAKTETVPVMEEVEETYTEMEPTGETRGALRYSQCSVIEAAWLRRELAALTARVSALEAL
jgi:hypothetical protein